MDAAINMHVNISYVIVITEIILKKLESHHKNKNSELFKI